MRIAFLEPHLKIFGGIRRIIELSNRLVERGHDVTIYHSDGQPCEWMPGLARTRPMEEVLDSPAEVLIYNNPSRIELQLARRSKHPLKIFFVLGLYEHHLMTGFHPSLYLPHNTQTRLTKRCILTADVRMTNATWLHQWLRQHLGVDSHLLLGGVNRELFRPIEVERDPDIIRVLTSGDPRYYKGAPTVREAINIAGRRDQRIRLQTYYGKSIPQSEMARTYCEADIFVEGSLHGGWNNPVAEAMSCRVPVVCTDIGAVEDFAHHGRTALVVPPEDPGAMAEAILKLAADPDLRASIAEAGYRRILQFDWDESTRRLEEILSEHLQQRRITEPCK